MKMKKGTMLALVALLVVALGCGFVGWKLWKRQQARKAAMRFEMQRSLKTTEDLTGERLATALEEENATMDRYEVLRPVIDDLDLVAFWNVEGPEEAMERLREATGFREGKEPGTITFVASDKDKDMTQKIGESVWKSYRAVLLSDRLRSPAPLEAPLEAP